MMDITYYHVNGRLCPAEEASFRVTDLATMRGYGVFDFFLVRNHQPMFLEDYLDRFYRSARLLYLEPPAPRQELREQIRELIDANGLADAGIRLLLTGGYASDGYTPGRPNLAILEHPFPTYPEEKYSRGIKAMTYTYQREVPEVKSTNYLTGIRLLGELRQRGLDEVIYHDGQYLRESDRSNCFLVLPGQRLVTPGEKILAGITRMKILELAKAADYNVEVREVKIGEIAAAQEFFVTSSTKGAMPVVEIDGRAVGSGQPGPLSKDLGKRFVQLTEDYLQLLKV